MEAQATIIAIAAKRVPRRNRPFGIIAKEYPKTFATDAMQTKRRAPTSAPLFNEMK
jgi:hypothetical protein